MVIGFGEVTSVHPNRKENKKWASAAAGAGVKDSKSTELSTLVLHGLQRLVFAKNLAPPVLVCLFISLRPSIAALYRPHAAELRRRQNPSGGGWVK